MTKVQAPRTKQEPSSKDQIPNRRVGAPVWSLFIGLWSLFGPWCLDLGTSPYSNFFTTAAAHWPASVYDTFTAYGFATGSGAPVCTRTGHSGSGVVWFGVP